MNFFFKAISYSIFLLLLSCNSTNEVELVGNWQAFEVLEEGELLPVNYKEIKFSFHADESYKYFSTLNYREAGSYFVEKPYLYTRDTLNQASSEKAVEIIKLTPDSLFLKMNEGNKQRILKLAKVQIAN